MTDKIQFGAYDSAMSKQEFFALAEKRKRDAAGSGVVEWGKHYSSGTNYVHINEGLWHFLISSDRLMFGPSGGGATDSNCISRTEYPVFNVNGVAHVIRNINSGSNVQSVISFPPAPDGLDKADGTGRFADLAAAISAGGTELSASVINRQDFCFLEVWHEKVSDKDILVPLGNVQYGATSWNGIALVGLNTLGVAQGYSAFGEWDTRTQGNGVRWSTLSDADKAKFVSDPENNIYLDETNELIQVRYRIRVVAGLEGDWSEYKPAIVTTLRFVGNSTGYVIAQGKEVTPEGLPSASGQHGYYTYHRTEGWRVTDADGDRGIFQSTGATDTPTSRAHNGLCFAVPICMVSRHNQGVKEPTYNSRGADRLTGDQFWYQNPTVIASVSDCFDPAKKAGKGTIASGVSGRDYGEYYDAIYAKYVQDLRKSSLVRPVDEIREEYKRKAIAGQANFTPTMWEKVPFTSIDTGTSSSSTGTHEFVSLPLDTYPSQGNRNLDVPLEGFYVVRDSDGAVFEVVQVNNTGGFCYLYLNSKYGSANNVNQTHHIVGVNWLEQRAAEHTWTDIIGDPARIAAIFPNGVQAMWIPEIPDGTTKDYKLNRKSLVSNVTSTQTNDDGGAWTHTQRTISETTNSFTTVVPATRVELDSYTTPAHFTEDRLNSEFLSLGDVFAGNWFDTAIPSGQILSSSLIGKVQTNGSQGPYNEDVTIVWKRINARMLNVASDDKPEHTALRIKDGGSGLAFKTLDYATENNGVLDLQYAYKEMIYDEGFDRIADFTPRNSSTSYGWGDVGAYYYFNVGAFKGIAGRLAKNNGTNVIEDVTYIGNDGNLYSTADNSLILEAWDGTGWGDNNKFEITNNQSTLTDDNGNTVLYGTAGFETAYFYLDQSGAFSAQATETIQPVEEDMEGEEN